MSKDEALKLALEALELHLTHHEHGCVYLDPAVTAIKETLAQPEQKPVAWGMPSAEGGFIVDCITPEEHDRVEGGYTVPLYTTPPQRKCKGIPRKGCSYLADCNSVCNKCGEIHHHHQMVWNHDHPAPPQRTWEGLTDDDLRQIILVAIGVAEAKLKQKNGYAEDKNT